MKDCNTCKKSLSYENYHVNKATRDGFSNRCKKCTSEIRKKKRASKPKKVYEIKEYKECKACHKTFHLSKFNKSKLTRDGREGKCRACRKKQRKKNNIVISSKKCTSCKKVLDVICFSKDASRDDGYNNICKKCKSEYYKAYSRDNSDKIREKYEYYKKYFPDKLKAYNKKHYENNKEHIIKRTAEYHKTYKGRYTLFTSQAKYRGIDCELDLNTYNELINEPCYYCGTEEHNGIDRLNSNLGYIKENVVPCCSTCNYGKNTLSPEEFLEHVFLINKFQREGIFEGRPPIVKYSGNPKNDHYLTPFGKFTGYKHSAKERGKKFDLEYEDFVSYWQKPCSYCGSTIDTIGLDRIDNTKGYSVSNITSCCTNCNNLKKEQTKDEFLKHCLRIEYYILL